jgi:spectrin beta
MLFLFCTEYRPCDAQIIIDRMSHLEAAYEELLQLAAERRSRLEDSRKMWQFYWDMADEEGWIKEKEQLMSSPDLGHDLTTVHLLLTKHKVGLFHEIMTTEASSQGFLFDDGQPLNLKKKIFF